jgi:hypothetical protein
VVLLARVVLPCYGNGMISKAQQILDALGRNDGCEALRIAAAFPHLGRYKEAITRGWSACQQPDFYRQLGKDPEQLIAVGVAAVRARYAISVPSV